MGLFLIIILIVLLFATVVEGKDDMNPNYISGAIEINGEPAPSGTIYTIEIMVGENKGYIYTGSVDDGNIPPFDSGKGNFWTGDQIGFSTGDEFEMTIEGCSDVVSGTFRTGGNNNVIIMCSDGKITSPAQGQGPDVAYTATQTQVPMSEPTILPTDDNIHYVEDQNRSEDPDAQKRSVPGFGIFFAIIASTTVIYLYRQ
ncbi:MAG: hypothetical protein KAT48_00075 [Bacteroidales bacterium]|nr:hypothetical protein [Bacteroidales bacterium]